MAPSLNLNIPLEDYGAPLAALLGGCALAIALRTWRHTRQAEPQAIELEETGTAARGTTPGAASGGSPLRAVDNTVAGDTAVDAIDTAVAGGAAVNATDIAAPTPLRVIVNAVATPFRAIANTIAGGATVGAMDTTVATPVRTFDNAIAMEEGGALVNAVTADTPDVADASD